MGQGGLTFAEEAGYGGDEDDGVRVSGRDQQGAEIGLLVQGRRYPAGLDGHEVAADSVYHRLEDREVLEARDHELQN